MYWYTSSLGSVDDRLRPFGRRSATRLPGWQHDRRASTHQDDVAYLGWLANRAISQPLPGSSSAPPLGRNARSRRAHDDRRRVSSAKPSRTFLATEKLPRCGRDDSSVRHRSQPAARTIGRFRRGVSPHTWTLTLQGDTNP